MTIDELEVLWSKAISEVLGEQIGGNELNILSRQTFDSIRRVQIYETYRLRAQRAVQVKETFIHTSNPFVLAQRSDLSISNRTWIVYLATYFGKSNKSHWELFNRASFRQDQTLIKIEEILAELDNYFNYLLSFEFFEGCSFSNHRKYTAKKLTGYKGLFRSMEYFVNHINSYSPDNEIEFHDMYLTSQKIPNFGRLGGFDFTSALVKCRLNVKEPMSMYANHSTGPLDGLKLLLKFTNNNTSKASQIQLSLDLMDWFINNSKIFMAGQVLEDAICNWQKNTSRYIRYTG
ncbi:alpha-glutamyl/putrescinyl thymine pyrophosphorylase clade 3 protein [Pleomorphovibrio marinus]|uniref:alpha-glutamyl/putrescinyl thymine pyrophosphorylase clade 3 protein n=1 Tax=Pleomorphovibrio marinus TaxID=2164132 RepID=UPI000E0AB185|nr:hypothetical protein [Pleomorphovibrio marinus]